MKDKKVLVQSNTRIRPGAAMFKDTLKAMAQSFQRENTATTISNSAEDAVFKQNIEGLHSMMKNQGIPLERIWYGDELCVWPMGHLSHERQTRILRP